MVRGEQSERTVMELPSIRLPKIILQCRLLIAHCAANFLWVIETWSAIRRPWPRYLCICRKPHEDNVLAICYHDQARSPNIPCFQDALWQWPRRKRIPLHMVVDAERDDSMSIGRLMTPGSGVILNVTPLLSLWRNWDFFVGGRSRVGKSTRDNQSCNTGRQGISRWCETDFNLCLCVTSRLLLIYIEMSRGARQTTPSSSRRSRSWWGLTKWIM